MTDEEIRTRLDEIKTKYQKHRVIWDYFPGEDLFVCVWLLPKNHRGETRIAKNEYADRDLNKLDKYLSELPK